MQERNGEQTLQATIGITREVGGKRPEETYVIQMIDDASGRLIAEARMDGSSFAKIVTGHIMTLPVRVADKANRQHFGQVESTISVSGFKYSSLDSIAGQSWLHAAEAALREALWPVHEVELTKSKAHGLIAVFRWWTAVPMPGEVRKALQERIPAIPSIISE